MENLTKKQAYIKAFKGFFIIQLSKTRVEVAHQAGIKAIIQPGGSIRDEDSIKKCNEYGITMVFTGMRHFKH